MITIKQIADQIGVSPTTVSNVIHGKAKEVSPATVEKIRRIVDELHYVPNMTARNLASRQTHIVGVILCFDKGVGAQALADPFNGELVGSVAAAIEERQFYTMMHITNDENEAIRLALSWNVDGLIICSMRKKEWSRIVREAQRPVVFVDSYFEGENQDYANIGLDDRGGGDRITSYLIAHGHRRIAFSSDNLISVDYERFQGYLAALRRAGIPFRDDWYLPFSPAEHDRAPREILRRREEFTSVFFASDYYASLAVNYFQDHGLRVPADLSVVGFDDNQFGRNVRPALTTVHQDPGRKGRLAVSLLMDLMEGKEPAVRNLHLPVALVERGSVRDLRPGK